MGKARTLKGGWACDPEGKKEEFITAGKEE